MPEIMKSEAVGKLGGPYGRLELCSVEVAVAKRPTLCRGEHQALALGSTLGEVGGQFVPKQRRQRHMSIGVGLGWTNYKATGDVAYRLSDLYSASQKVDSLHPQGTDLISPQAGVGGGELD
jgi:hypothetical protein